MFYSHRSLADNLFPLYLLLLHFFLQVLLFVRDFFQRILRLVTILFTVLWLPTCFDFVWHS